MKEVTKRKLLTTEELSKQLSLNIITAISTKKDHYLLIIDVGIGYYRASYTVGQTTQIKFEGKLNSNGKPSKTPFKKIPHFRIKNIK